FVYRMQEEGAACRLEAALGTTEHQGAELEACVDVREERLPVLEIQQCRQPSAGGDPAEEPGRSLVGSNARRRQQAHHAGAPYLRGCPLHEQAVEIDVAAG